MLSQTGPQCGVNHNVQFQNSTQVSLVRRIQNWTNTVNVSTPSNSQIIGWGIKENAQNDTTFNGSYSVNVNVTESWSVTAGASIAATVEAKTWIFPVGASWETTVHLSGTYGNTERRGWQADDHLVVPPCKRKQVQVFHTNERVNVSVEEGTLEHYTYLCNGETQPSSIVYICGYDVVTGTSSRYQGAVISRASNADPYSVPGCHDPLVGGGDLDGDGVPNDEDPDVDDDGIPNGDDRDIDGDGIPNDQDPDMDADGIPNEQDSDMDGDGKPNGEDDDIDGDGIPNDQDSDMDGDGVDNATDNDVDGDGIINEEDDEPNGTTGGGSWVNIILKINGISIPILLPLR